MLAAGSAACRWSSHDRACATATSHGRVALGLVGAIMISAYYSDMARALIGRAMPGHDVALHERALRHA